MGWCGHGSDETQTDHPFRQACLDGVLEVDVEPALAELLQLPGKLQQAMKQNFTYGIGGGDFGPLRQRSIRPATILPT
jgi:hypothetical protein